MEKIFNWWNQQKQKTAKKKVSPQFKIRDIFWTRVGQNIGFEQNGKGEDFMRPVLIVKKFNKHLFWGIPLSTRGKTGKYYFPFEFQTTKKSVAILSQMRLFDAKRLERKIGNMSQLDFESMKKAIHDILDDF